MVQEAELHAQKDQERKSTHRHQKQCGHNYLQHREELGREYRDKVRAEVVSEIEAAVAVVRKEMASDDIELIKAKLDAANNAVSKIGEHMSGGGGGGGAGGSQSGGSQGGGDHQSPETEYEEAKK